MAREPGFCKGGRWSWIGWLEPFCEGGSWLCQRKRISGNGDRFSNYICCSPGIFRGSMNPFGDTARASFVSPDLLPRTLPRVAPLSPPVTPGWARFSFPRVSSPLRITPHSWRFSTSTWRIDENWHFARDFFGKTSLRKTALGSMELLLPFICILYQTVNTFLFLSNPCLLSSSIFHDFFKFKKKFFFLQRRKQRNCVTYILNHTLSLSQFTSSPWLGKPSRRWGGRGLHLWNREGWG